MSECWNRADFKQYFNENMQALGAPVPPSTLAGLGAVMAAIKTIWADVVKIGPHTTMRQLAHLRGLAWAQTGAAMYASAWLGMALGSIAVATGRSAGCGSSLADALWAAREMGLIGREGPPVWLNDAYRAHPEIFSMDYVSP